MTAAPARPLRIIAGSLKGRRLAVPPGDAVRPTSDRLRETLFNVLGPTLEGARVLDAFAGTGALGIEALSRGAARATFIERDAAVARELETNIAHCGVEKACAIIRGDFAAESARLAARRASGATGDVEFDLILIDPPYAIDDLADVLAQAGALTAEGGRVVLEHARRRESPERAASLVRTRVLLSGDSALSFFAPTPR